MSGSLMRKERIAAQILFALSVLLAAQAQAQSIVGTWTGYPGTFTFQANGQWSATYPPRGSAGSGLDTLCNLNVAVTEDGSYTVSGGSISISVKNHSCASGGLSPYYAFIGGFSSGTYVIDSHGLTIYPPRSWYGLGCCGPLSAIGVTNITPSDPLPPPPTTQTVFTVPTGQLPSAAAQVTATGTYGSAFLKVILDIAKALPATFAASPTYNVYVAALVPGAALGSASSQWFVKPKAPGNWGALQTPIAAYLEKVAQIAVNNQVVIDILTNTDISSLVGTEIYIGYGTSSDEMLAANRYRGVYKVQ
jgi:hypothetical protein